MPDQDWLSNLKDGDEVAIRFHGYRQRECTHLGTLERRTPSGRLVVRWNEYAVTFNPNGVERSTSSRRGTLVEITPEINEQVERARLVEDLTYWPWSEMKLDALRQVAAVLKAWETVNAEAGNA